MKYRRFNQPGIVDAVTVPAAEAAIDSNFSAFIGCGASIAFMDGEVHISSIRGRGPYLIICRPGDHIVRDEFDNLSLWKQCFFQHFFQPVI